MANLEGTHDLAIKAQKSVAQQIHELLFPGIEYARTPRYPSGKSRAHRDRAHAPNDGRWHMKHHRGR